MFTIGKILILILLLAVALSSCVQMNIQNSQNNPVASENLEATGLEDELGDVASVDLEDFLESDGGYARSNEQPTIDEESSVDGDDQFPVSSTSISELEATGYSYANKFTFYFGYWHDDGLLITNWHSEADTSPARRGWMSSDSYYPIRALPDARIVMEGHGDRPSPVTDITTTQWEDWGIQVFRFAGDITLIGGRGSLTQIPEFNEDDFHFRLDTHENYSQTSREFELQYIMRHEISDSALCRLLGIEPCD